jgi:hypothetical protein
MPVLDEKMICVQEFQKFNSSGAQNRSTIFSVASAFIVILVSAS